MTWLLPFPSAIIIGANTAIDMAVQITCLGAENHPGVPARFSEP
jgi:hypothetical protein